MFITALPCLRRDRRQHLLIVIIVFNRNLLCFVGILSQFCQRFSVLFVVKFKRRELLLSPLEYAEQRWNDEELEQCSQQHSAHSSST